MSVLGLATIFICIMLICNSILQAHGLVNLPVLTVVVGGLVKIVVNYILVGNYDINIKGAPVGTLCCFAVAAGMDLFFVHRALPVSPSYTRVFVKPLCASVLMGLAAWGSHKLLSPILGNAIATLGGICVGVLVYGILILALKAISMDDLALMPKGDKIAKVLKIQ
jgi:stage V sporulation protein B